MKGFKERRGLQPRIRKLSLRAINEIMRVEEQMKGTLKSNRNREQGQRHQGADLRTRSGPVMRRNNG